jgi:pyruvate/2-oxoglutarate dehydrogenase complex dihydrolipoamide acyltransferase (E2) component
MMRTVVVLDEATQKPTVVTYMNATLSADARCVSEETASRFLEAFGRYLSDPTNMIV